MLSTIHAASSLLLFIVAISPILCAELTDADLDVVSQRCADGSTHSWEIGNRALAILTLSHSSYSLFHSSPLPPSTPPPPSISPVFSIAHDTVTKLQSPGISQALQPNDASAADPTSIGVAVLLANLTHQIGADYAGAARGQLDFLHSNQVPKSMDGAMSHKRENVQLWSDFIAMVPPFLAYYGVATSNQSLVLEAYNQIRLYRNYLRDPSTGLWRHIALANQGGDPGLWSTGNGWATIGILRVLSITQRSQWKHALMHQQKDLANWTYEILRGVYKGNNLNPKTSMLTNYLPPSAPGNFEDAASTALLAASAYRLSLLANRHDFIPCAERSRTALSSTSPPASPRRVARDMTAGLVHFEDGWLKPVVDPLSVGNPGQRSPEAQAFVMEMQGAWKDWASKKKESGAMRGLSVIVWPSFGALLAAVALAC